MNKPETYNSRIAKTGHRHFVGAPNNHLWHFLGKMQYHYLVSLGLRPDHKFLDVGCGSLRLGQWLIPMLNKGNYYGLDGTEKLVELGIKNEMLYDVVAIKNPHFSYNYDFDFSFLNGRFDYAIAQSLFTHLTINDISKCFRNLRTVMHKNSLFAGTFFEGDEANNPKCDSDPHLNWHYSFVTLQQKAKQSGLHLTYVGDWGHPRKQKLFKAQII